MKSPYLFSKYIVNYFLKYLFNITLLSFLVILLIEFLGFMKHFYSKGHTLLDILKISFMATPQIIQEIMLILILISAMITFLTLSRNMELIAARAMGFSVWNFILPVASASFFLGLLFIFFVNPVVANMYGKFIYLEQKYNSRENKFIEKDIWFKQIDEKKGTKTTVYLIKSKEKLSNTIKKISLFVFDKNNEFKYRVESKKVEVSDNIWKLKEAKFFSLEKDFEDKEDYVFISKLKFSDLENLYKEADSISFFELPKVINMLKLANIENLRHRALWHLIMSSPLSYFTIVFIAGVFSLRFSSRDSLFIFYLIGGFIVGLGVKFIYNTTISYVVSSNSNPFVFIWFPVFIILAISTLVIINNEEG